MNRTTNENLSSSLVSLALNVKSADGQQPCFARLYAYANSYLRTSNAAVKSTPPAPVGPSVLRELMINGRSQEDICRGRGLSRTEMMRKLRQELQRLR
ncbi:hypothetical protein [Pedobacter sp. SYP-B3415]|uniref:hypothetical protein n=1 Tax=Pedobacter sp. SYP-B3415 TaxID=2496641 RepID=UPI00101DA48F|nr:hypothetical protein [Pedobacter sp. SYP-B3415]